MSRTVVYTDIDGTLIDAHTYSFRESEAAVHALLQHHIPLVLCSSKTRAEQEALRLALGIPDPFIVENGGAVYIPENYFTVPVAEARSADGWQVIELGTSAEFIRQTLAGIRRQTGLRFKGYADLSAAEVAEVTGLELSAAEQARDREYSETIVTPLSEADRQQLRRELEMHGLSIVSGGRFHTVMGAGGDKGKAVDFLNALFRREFGEIHTIGLGDSANDEPLLAAVDRPYLVQRPGGVWHETSGTPVHKVAAVGPLGWRQVITAELNLRP
ncbi:MAG: mannosyl-3-phosphoglycerate phosphatase [Chloroflexota bacterium]